MAKHTPPKPKTQIGGWLGIEGWLGAPELRNKLRRFYLDDHASYEEIREVVRWFHLRVKRVGLDGTGDALHGLWKKCSQWKMERKKRLGEEGRKFFFTDEGFRKDFAGDADKALVEKLSHDEEREKCWHRCYTPKNDFADNFRLEVVTTPDDDQVVGWVVVAH